MIIPFQRGVYDAGVPMRIQHSMEGDGIKDMFRSLFGNIKRAFTPGARRLVQSTKRFGRQVLLPAAMRAGQEALNTGLQTAKDYGAARMRGEKPSFRDITNRAGIRLGSRMGEHAKSGINKALEFGKQEAPRIAADAKRAVSTNAARTMNEAVSNYKKPVKGKGVKSGPTHRRQIQAKMRKRF